jgi:hypothetical protein
VADQISGMDSPMISRIKKLEIREPVPECPTETAYIIDPANLGQNSNNESFSSS